jgi:TonB family protein
MIQERRKRNSSKINLIISAVFHSVLIVAVVFFAAREGMLGKKLKELTVVMVPKEKKPEPPKEKPEEPKVEQAKVEETPKLSVPQPKAETVSAPPTANDAPPAVAPAAVALPSFQFSDGAHEVESISDPNGIYKALVEHTLRSRWNRPEDLADDNFVAEVEVTINPSGKVKDFRWLTGSGDTRWDNSVKAVLAQTKVISRAPPKGFPEKFTVRFDVESMRTETVQLSSR